MLPSEMLQTAVAALRRYERDGNEIDRCRMEVRVRVARRLAAGLSQRDVAQDIREERDEDSRAFRRTRIMRCWDCQTARDEVIAELLGGADRYENSDDGACTGCGAVTSRGEVHSRSCENA